MNKVKDNVSRALYNVMNIYWYFTDRLIHSISEKEKEENFKKQIQKSKNFSEVIVKNCLPNDEAYKTTLNYDKSNDMKFVFDLLHTDKEEEKRKMTVSVIGRLYGVQVEVIFPGELDFDLETEIKQKYKDSLETEFDYFAEWI